MIVAAAVCPHPPLLFRELSGRQDVAAELRAACEAAVASVLSSDPDAVVVVGGDEAGGSWDSAVPFDLRGFGTTHPRATTGPATSTGSAPTTGAAGAATANHLPLSLGVARRLLDGAGRHGPVEMHTIAWDAPQPDIADLGRSLASGPERRALLVLGEGSARRGEKAPGYLDDRAFSFDEAIGHALETGDTGSLLDMDPALARDLMVTGRAPFGVLAAAVQTQGGAPRPKLLYQDDPWGVMYFVATWDVA